MSHQFMIKWFRENITGVVEDLGLGGPVYQSSVYHNYTVDQHVAQ